MNNGSSPDARIQLHYQILSTIVIEPMASKLPTRALSTFSHPVRRRPSCTNSARILSAPQPRCISKASSRHEEMETDSAARPRWQYTPTAMRAPLRSRPVPEETKRFSIRINSDPARLDQVYLRMLGPEGDKMLSEETKWLAVTHKSFDHGRRGFNDRLAYLGMSTVQDYKGQAANALGSQEDG